MDIDQVEKIEDLERWLEEALRAEIDPVVIKELAMKAGWKDEELYPGWWDLIESSLPEEI